MPSLPRGFRIHLYSLSVTGAVDDHPSEDFASFLSGEVPHALVYGDVFMTRSLPPKFGEGESVLCKAHRAPVSLSHVPFFPTVLT